MASRKLKKKKRAMLTGPVSWGLVQLVAESLHSTTQEINKDANWTSLREADATG